MISDERYVWSIAILNYNFVMLDHPRNLFVHLKFLLKFRVCRVHTFRNIAIQKFCKFGFKCFFRPQKSCFWGFLTPKHYFFITETPKRPYLTWVSLNWLKNVGAVGVEISAFSLTWHIAYTTACSYRTSCDKQIHWIALVCQTCYDS